MPDTDEPWMQARPGSLLLPECLDQYGQLLGTFGFNEDGDAWIPLVYAKAHGAGIEIWVLAQMEDEACAARSQDRFPAHK